MRRVTPEATTVKRLRFVRRGEERIMKAVEPTAIKPARPKKRIVERAMMKLGSKRSPIEVSCGHVHICALVKIRSKCESVGCI
jgi:hypothetical protein